MKEIRLFFYKNRKKIGIFALLILAMIILPRFFNGLVKKNKTIKKEVEPENKTLSYAIISESDVSKEIQDNTIETIEKYIKYCNDGDIESAYNMLSEKCKEKKYISQEVFKRVFYDTNFDTKKEYSLQAWINNTYKIKIYEDMLATGKSIKDNFTIEDYYTVVEEDGEYKLNINGYIETEVLENKKNKTENIEIEVLEKDIYIDYEIYKIKVKNNTEKPIMLDTKEEKGSIYITNDNDVMFSAFLNELNISKIMVDNGVYKIIEIKFDNNYKADKKIENMVFSKIMLDINDKTKTEELKIEL